MSKRYAILIALLLTACGKPQQASVDKDPLRPGDVANAGPALTEYPLASQELGAGYSFFWRSSETVDGDEQPISPATLLKQQKAARTAAAQLEAALYRLAEMSRLERLAERLADDQAAAQAEAEKAKKAGDAAALASAQAKAGQAKDDRAKALKARAALGDRAPQEKARDAAAGSLRTVSDLLALTGKLEIRVDSGQVVEVSVEDWDLDGSGPRDFSTRDGTLVHVGYEPRGGVHELRLPLSAKRTARLTLSRRPVAAEGHVAYGADRLDIEENGAVVRTGLAGFAGGQ